MQTVTVVYDTANRRTRTTLLNGIAMAYTYDAVSRVTGIMYQRADGTAIGGIFYTYDANGNITQKDGSLSAALVADIVAPATDNANNQLTTWNDLAPKCDCKDVDIKCIRPGKTHRNN